MNLEREHIPSNESNEFSDVIDAIVERLTEPESGKIAPEQINEEMIREIVARDYGNYHESDQETIIAGVMEAL